MVRRHCWRSLRTKSRDLPVSISGGRMAKLDLKITNGTVATAADVFRCDIGVRNGRIVLLGDDLPPAEVTIDARGKLVMPGGIDSHCHMDQQPWEGRTTADDFRS